MLVRTVYIPYEGINHWQMQSVPGHFFHALRHACDLCPVMGDDILGVRQVVAQRFEGLDGLLGTALGIETERLLYV